MEPNTPPVGHTRLRYDHGIYTTLKGNDYLVVQCFSPQSLRRQLIRMRLANRERIYWTTDEAIQ